MNCGITELRNKEVINKNDGCRLGHVCDIEVDTCCGRVAALIIYGRPRCMGLLGREPDIRICWENVEVIGDDTVLVCYAPPAPSFNAVSRKKNFWDGFFR